MKKIAIISVIVVLAFILILVLGTKKEDDSKYFNTISMKEFNKLIRDKEDFVLVFSQDGCSHCEKYLPVVSKVANDNKIKIYNINLTKLDAIDKSNISNNYNIKATPTTIFIKSGKEDVQKRIVSSPSEEELVEKLKEYNYLK